MAHSARMRCFVISLDELATTAPAVARRLLADADGLLPGDVVTVRVIDGWPVEWTLGSDPIGLHADYCGLLDEPDQGRAAPRSAGTLGTRCPGDLFS